LKPKRRINPAVITAGIAAVFLGVAASAALSGGTPALATADNTAACGGCHTNPGTITITTTVTTISVAPSASIPVSISWAGGGGIRTEINWPDTQSNTLFSPAPRVPYSSSGASGTTSSTLTAPVTPGTYTVRVYAAQKLPGMQSVYKDMTITVTAPAPVTYTMSVSASPALGGAVTGGGSYASGATVSLGVTANSGYHFVNWTQGATVASTLQGYSFPATAARTLVANFAINTYTITASAGANGTITPSGSVDYGGSKTFTITPNAGYRVASVTVDGASAGTVTSYPFSNVAANHTISATFAADATATYSLTYTAGTNGTISGTSPQSVAPGGNGTAVTATPAAGYHFVSWSDGSTANPRTDNAVAGIVSVTASFAIDTHTITPTAGANGSISPLAAVTVPHNASQSFTITADSGYVIAGITVDGSPVAPAAATLAASTPAEITTSSYVFTNVTASHSISATFTTRTTTGSDITGPLTSGLRFTSRGGAWGSLILGAAVDDTSTGSSSIASAEYFLDRVDAPGTGAAMAASDRGFNSARETVRASVKLAGLSAGSHTIYVRGRDAAGNWGATARLAFQVRTTRRMPAGTVGTFAEDDDRERSSTSTLVVWVGTGRQPVTDD
jgi:hypothetical protein